MPTLGGELIMTDASGFPLPLSKEEILDKYWTLDMHPESYCKFGLTFKGVASDGVEIFATIDQNICKMLVDLTSVQMLGVLHDESGFDSIDAYPSENKP